MAAALAGSLAGFLLAVIALKLRTHVTHPASAVALLLLVGPALFDTTLPFDAQRQSYSVSADQRFLLNDPVDTDSSPFTIVLNWTGLLKH